MKKIFSPDKVSASFQAEWHTLLIVAISISHRLYEQTGGKQLHIL